MSTVADHDMHVARAMDRVLEAERAAQSAIAECATRNQESLERARQQARGILERAHERIVALHTRAACTIEQRQAQERRNTQPVSMVAAEADCARFEAAIRKLAERLVELADEEM